MATNWPNENVYTVDDPYNLKLGVDDRRKNDRGSKYPSDLGDVHPGTKIQPIGGTMEASSPGPESSTPGGAGIPQPDGYGGSSNFPDAPPPGPDSDAYEDPDTTGSAQQDALNDLPNADASEYVDCPTITNNWVQVDLIEKPAGGGPCSRTREGSPRGVCTGEWYEEKIVFNCQADAEAYRDEMLALASHVGLTGDTVLWYVRYTAGNDDCQNTGECDGPIAYKNDVASGYGSGALRDGMESFEWGE